MAMTYANLDQLFDQCNTDKGQNCHGYGAFYERHIGHLRDRECSVLEIGVAQGASLRAWEIWLPYAEITGIDKEEHCRYDSERVNTITADVTTWTPEGSYDLIVDDGSHRTNDIEDALVKLWDHLVPGGWYVVEDLSQPQFDLGTPPFLTGAFTNLMNCKHVQVSEMHVYCQIVFLRKCPQGFVER